MNKTYLRGQTFGKIGTAPIIIHRLSRCMQALGMPRMPRVVAIGFPYHLT